MKTFKMLIIVAMITAIITGCAEGGAVSVKTSEPIFSTICPLETEAVSVLDEES